jgi:hypothetical protein
MSFEPENTKEKKEDLSEILDKKTGIIVNWGITIIFILACLVLIYIKFLK